MDCRQKISFVKIMDVKRSLAFLSLCLTVSNVLTVHRFDPELEYLFTVDSEIRIDDLIEYY